MQSANPFLILGYGAQMMFILEQRLLAQNVKNEKGCKVLSDVAGSLYDPSFIDELLKPTAGSSNASAARMWSPQETRQVFENLASSSIMKLSSASMDKLYDLMTMGLKYSTIMSVFPRDITHNSLRLLGAIQELLNTAASGAGNPERNNAILSHVNAAISSLYAVSETLSLGQCMDIRYGMLNFLQGRKIRVTLFLNEGLQNKQGQFILTQSRNVTSATSGGGQAPQEQFPSMKPIGTVRYFSGGAEVGSEVLSNHPHVSNAAVTNEVVPEVKIGHLLYGTDRLKGGAKPATAAAAPSAPAPTAPEPTPSTASSSSSSTGQQQMVIPTVNKTTSNAAVNNIMGLAAVSFNMSGSSDGFKLNLFGDDENDLLHTEGGGEAKGAQSVEIVAGASSSVQHLQGVMSGFDQPQPAAAGGDDDLLDLMEGNS